MHVLDYILNKMSRLLRFNNYPLNEKAYPIMPHSAGLSLRELAKGFFGYLKQG